MEKLPDIKTFLTKRTVMVGNDVYTVNRFFTGKMDIEEVFQKHILSKARLEENKHD